MKLIFSFVTILVIIMSSCTTLNRSIQTVPVQSVSIEPLNRDEYVIMDEVEGYGFASSIFIFDIGSGFSGNDYVSRAKAKALYDAISKIEGADAIIAPRIEVEIFKVPLFYREATVKVKAKAIRIKISGEN